MALYQPAFPGLPLPGNQDYADFRIWSEGIARHAIEGKTTGQERCYLRGMHSPAAINHLIDYLKEHIPKAVFQCKSVWVDKTPQAYFGMPVKNCELGDLLVLVRVKAITGNTQTQRETGWLLQAKTAHSPTHVEFSGSSTGKEIDLYQNHIKFSLQHGNTKLGTYDLNQDADINSGNAPSKWSFLQYCLDDVAYGTGWASHSPVQQLWPLPAPASAPAPAQAAIHGSFAQAILDIALVNDDSAAPFGVLLHKRNAQWQKMCRSLVAFTAARAGKLSGGAAQHQITRFFDTGYPNRAFHLLRMWNERSSFFQNSPRISAGDSMCLCTSGLQHSFNDSEKAWELLFNGNLRGDPPQEPPDGDAGDFDGEGDAGGVNLLILDIARQFD